MNMERSQSKDDDDEVQAQLSVYRGSNETAEHFMRRGMRRCAEQKRRSAFGGFVGRSCFCRTESRRRTRID